MADPKCVGFVGWRGSVGNVVVRRLLGSQHHWKAILFSSSEISGADVLTAHYQVRRTSQLKLLTKCSVILASQGSLFSESTLPQLRRHNWKGYWIDAASSLRNQKCAAIILDPVNHQQQKGEVRAGTKSFVGGNCTVSLMLMAVSNVLKRDLVSQLLVTTFQSVSGGGIRAVRTFLDRALAMRESDLEGILELTGPARSNWNLHAVTPWIDSNTRRTGTTREELKGIQELSKMTTASSREVAISSVCVRVGVLRCHSQSIFLRLSRDPNVSWLVDVLQSSHCWLKLVPNLRTLTIHCLTPYQVVGTLTVLVGRVKKATAHFISVFTIGDQLLWGAAEPIVRFGVAISS